MNAPPVDADSFLQSIEAEVEAAIASVKDGSHAELVKRAEALNRAKENKIAAADRHRKMQIKNITAQYEYEVEDASSLYNVSLLSCVVKMRYYSNVDNRKHTVKFKRR